MPTSTPPAKDTLVSFAGPIPTALDILGLGIVVPEDRVSIEAIYEQEGERINGQLAQLTPAFRERLTTNLGISCVASFGAMSSCAAGRTAARLAVERAGLQPDCIGCILDYSTYAVDRPGVWSLAHDIQGHLDVATAFSLGVCGSGCAGLHAALLVASAMFSAHPTLQAALLVAADRAPNAGRSCLPISLMADAATAMVVARTGTYPHPLGRIRSIAMQQNGIFSNLLLADSDPPRMTIDAEAFERKVLPQHFVMLHRVLMRALTQANLQLSDLDGVVYPNTTALDRNGLARGFGFSETMLVGPGPNGLGHAFANDMLINAATLFDAPSDNARRVTAWLAAGSGFSWGAAIVELGTLDATR
jgi:3-oxoacyl-[acyl-carrier-protein] synthase III